MGRKLLGSMGTCALLALQPAQALADENAPFASAGQVVISSGAELSVRHVTSYDTNDYGTQIVVAPAADVFVGHGFSVGGQLLAGTLLNYHGSWPRFGFGPRVGYGVPLSQHLSFHGTLGVTYEAERFDMTTEKITGDLFAPLLVHPVQHFFVGFGPHVAHEFKKWTHGHDHPRYTTLAVRSVIGGYF